MSAHAASDVAAEIRQRIPGIPTKKLHKLLYYCQAHHVVAFGHPLFAEAISAWDMGPVVGRLWRTEKDHGVESASTRTQLDEPALNTIGYVVSRYGKLSGADLERLTHNESPWIDADQERRARSAESARITVEALAEFFGREAAEDDEVDVPVARDLVASWLAGAVELHDGSFSEDTADRLASLLR
jgi:uncharacterized phage-associated protein